MLKYFGFIYLKHVITINFTYFCFLMRLLQYFKLCTWLAPQIVKYFLEWLEKLGCFGQKKFLISTKLHFDEMFFLTVPPPPPRLCVLILLHVWVLQGALTWLPQTSSPTIQRSREADFDHKLCFVVPLSFLNANFFHINIERIK